MRAISRRLTQLEKAFAPRVREDDGWGTMARFRDELLAQTEQQGATSIAEVGAELERIGPSALWLEAARCYLRDHGFGQSGNESLGQTMARALGISTHELRV